MKNIKIVICLMWFGGLMLDANCFFINTSAAFRVDKTKPESALIERFNEAIQQRFLNEPDFGVSRIARPNPHLRAFTPTIKEESDLVEALQKGGWQTGLYLYGRRAVPKSIANPKEFEFIYLNNPAIAITRGLERKQLAEPDKLLKEVKVAFDSFANQDSYEFEQNKWSYVARPVRARQSCLQCHTDFGLGEKDNEENYLYRPKVGDAIGVVVYAFAKSKNQFAAKE
jgi:hypothetical protein